MGTHYFSAQSPPMLLAASKRKSKVLLVVCEVLSDIPLTSSPPDLSFLGVCPAPLASLLLPYTSEFSPPSELALPSWTHLSLVSLLRSQLKCHLPREAHLSTSTRISSLHPHMVAGHSPAIVQSSLLVVSEIICFIYSFLACLPR